MVEKKKNLFAKQTNSALENYLFTIFCLLPQVNNHGHPMSFSHKKAFRSLFNPLQTELTLKKPL